MGTAATVNVAVVANTTQLQQGMKDATNVVKTAAQEMAEAQIKARQAAADLAAGFKKFGPAAKEGGDVANVVLKVLQERANEAKEAVRALNEEQSRSVSSTIAIGGAVRDLEGHYQTNIRAVERLISLSPTMAAAFQAMFPITGAIALLGIVVKTGEELSKFITTNIRMATTIRDAFQKASIGYRETTDALAVTNDKLENEIAKLEGRPGDGLRLGLDEAKLAADRLFLSLAKDNDETAALLGQKQVGVFAGLFTHQKSTSDAKTLFEVYKNQVQSITAAGEERERKAKTADEAQQARTETQNTVLGLQGAMLDVIAEKRAALAANGGSKHYNAALDASYAAIQNSVGDQVNRANETSRNEADEKAKAAAEQAHQEAARRKEAARAARAAARERREQQMREDEDAFAEMQAHQEPADSDKFASEHYNKVISDEQDSAFWHKAAKTFPAKSQQAMSADKQASHFDADAAKQTVELQQQETHLWDELIDRTHRFMAGLNQKNDDNYLKQSGKDTLAFVQSLQAEAKAQADAVDMADRAAVQAAIATGTTTKLGAAEAQAALHAREYKRELDELTQSLEYYQNLPGLSDTERRTQVNNVQAKITTLNAQHQSTETSDHTAQVVAISAPIQHSFDGIESAWMQTQDKLLEGTRNVSRQFAIMGGQMALSVINNMSRAAIHAVAQMATMRIAHAVMSKEQVASSATAAAQTQAIQTTSVFKQIFMEAKAAAAKAFNWGTGIGGPVMGGIAAGAAFSGVMALAAFKQGTDYVPRDGVAMLHEGEAVLNNSAAKQYREGGMTGAGSQTHFHFSPTLTGNDHEQLARNLYPHFREHVRKELRTAHAPSFA